MSVSATSTFFRPCWKYRLARLKLCRICGRGGQIYAIFKFCLITLFLLFLISYIVDYFKHNLQEWDLASGAKTDFPSTMLSNISLSHIGGIRCLCLFTCCLHFYVFTEMSELIYRSTPYDIPEDISSSSSSSSSSSIRPWQPLRVWAASLWRFRDHTEGRTTVGRTPLDEWSARGRDLYLTTNTTLTTDNHPCPRRDSNHQSQQAVGLRHAP